MVRPKLSESVRRQNRLASYRKYKSSIRHTSNIGVVDSEDDEYFLQSRRTSNELRLVLDSSSHDSYLHDNLSFVNVSTLPYSSSNFELTSDQTPKSYRIARKRRLVLDSSSDDSATEISTSHHRLVRQNTQISVVDSGFGSGLYLGETNCSGDNNSVDNSDVQSNFSSLSGTDITTVSQQDLSFTTLPTSPVDSNSNDIEVTSDQDESYFSDSSGDDDYQSESDASESGVRATRESRRVNNEQRRLREAALGEINASNVSKCNFGNMDHLCKFCQALHFIDELPRDKIYSKCCQKGIVKLPPLRTHPLIQQLMLGEHKYSREFFKNICSINSSLAFASMGVMNNNKDKPIPGRGPSVYRLHGQVVHRVGTLKPEAGETPSFAQLYILNPEEAAMHRINSASQHTSLLPELMQELSSLMADINQYAQDLMMLHEKEKECLEELRQEDPGAEIPIITMRLVTDSRHDQHRFAPPTRHDQVAMVFEGNQDGQPPSKRDLLMYNRRPDGVHKLQRLSVINPNVDPMTYPLLFPYGEQGWSPEMRLCFDDTPAYVRERRSLSCKPRERLTQQQFYSYHFHVRGDFNPVLSARRLTQQFAVDAFAKIEGNRLNFVALNQKLFRIETYLGLVDHLLRNDNTLPGIWNILPSSFPGSRRNMMQNYQDGMAICRTFGKPQLFLTMTCNPSWPEIQNHLQAGQKPVDRPDLVNRVFHLKLDRLMFVIDKKSIFGKCLAFLYVIEFQKRGLPHAHIVLWLEKSVDTAQQVDQIIRAYLPNPETEPELFDMVVKHMIHGPCDERCQVTRRVDGKQIKFCKRGYRKEFSDETVLDKDGFPKYHRPNTHSTNIERGGLNYEVDSSVVVPFNAFLLLMFDCHINVEVCATIKAIRYLFKYIYKGYDCADLEMSESGHDEIKDHQMMRYISATSAVWRIFGFEMQKRSHTVKLLQVHLPHEHYVRFKECNDSGEMRIEVERALREVGDNTTLMKWFQLNQEDSEARRYLYQEIPLHYVQDKVTKKWKKRKRSTKVISRLRWIDPQSDDELHCLRLLLLHLPGLQSFEDVRTVVWHDVDGTSHKQVLPTFRKAAEWHGYVKNEDLWRRTVEEAILAGMPRQLRRFVAHIILGWPLSKEQSASLWHEFKSDLADDYFHRHQQSMSGAHDDECQRCLNRALLDINYELITSRNKTCLMVGLPAPDPTGIPSQLIGQLEDEDYMAANFDAQMDYPVESLNQAQRGVFDRVMAAVEVVVSGSKPSQHLFFVDGPAGSGKTYLYKTIIHHLKSMGHKVVAVASTGIAANLLDGGRTYHSHFHLPIPIVSTTSFVRASNPDGQLIAQSSLLIWDEISMASGMALNAANELYQRLMENKVDFGGKVVLLGGDFRQTLPIVPHGSPADIIQASVLRSEVWPKFNRLELQVNQRCTEPEYNKFILDIGDGKKDWVEVPPEMLCQDVVHEIYGQSLNPTDHDNYSDCAILCPTNKAADVINARVLDLLQCETDVVTYLSTDSVAPDETNSSHHISARNQATVQRQEVEENSQDDAESDGMSQEERTVIPTEYLHSLTPSSLPPHELKLKIGAIVILLRNTNTTLGLCNGTRLLVTALHQTYFQATVLTGIARNSRVFITRKTLYSSADSDLPFVLSRFQFPVKLAFAITINKAQGQTLSKVGLWLSQQVFSHGQLYVAFSRVRSSKDIKVQVEDVDGVQGKLEADSNSVLTPNVVYKQVLTY